jgi:cellulose synthase/poly-beta-1,6-N-acetylglucosamine synthase-like glycosyltransferase
MNLTNLLTTVFSVIFFVVVLSYYALILWPRRIPLSRERFRSITVIIPAHNEASRIRDAITSVLAARWRGIKRIIVVDDGSTDDTANVARAVARSSPKGSVTVIRVPHSGKSNAINTALKASHSDLVAVVDGDSVIAPDAFEECIALFWSRKVGAVSAAMRVRNRGSVLGEWLNIELLYASLVRSLYAKVNANITATGPLTVFRRHALESVGGFSVQGFAEDVDIAVRLLKHGWRLEYATGAMAETVMPTTWSGFVRQRIRFARGAVDIIKRHLSFDRHFFQIYTLPLFFFTYAQAVVMAIIITTNIVSGYVSYFASQGTYLNWGVVKYFVEWLSIVGTVRWVWSVFTGSTPVTVLTGIAITTTLLTYPLYIFAILRFEKRIDWRHVLAMAFLFPFWLIVMVVYCLTVWEWGRKEQRNIWTK